MNSWKVYVRTCVRQENSVPMNEFTVFTISCRGNYFGDKEINNCNSQYSSSYPMWVNLVNFGIINYEAKLN